MRTPRIVAETSSSPRSKLGMNETRFTMKRTGPAGSVLFFLLVGCSVFHERPIQLMSDTAAALKAAKEVSADSLAAEKFRRANEAYFRAQNEYRLKNFAIAEDHAKRAKRLAEESEFEALNQGSNRTSLLPPEIPAGPPPPSTYEPPQGELATEVMKRGTTGNAPSSSGSGASSPPP